jgi:hypothetical protein
VPTTHCWPNGSANPPTTVIPAGLNLATNIAPTGTLKGVMVYLHGGSTVGTIGFFPFGIADGGGFLPIRALTLANTIAATGWRVIAPIMPADAYSPGGGLQLIYNDINGDAGHGSRLVATHLEWWDHIVWYIQKNISASVPIVPVGLSWGGYVTMQVAIGRTSTIGGYVSHHGASILADTNPVYTPNVIFSNTTTTGADVTSSALNGITSIPGLLGWGSADQAVGASPWTGDTLTPAIYAAAHTAGATVSPNCDGTGTSSAGSPTEGHVLTSSADNADPNNDVFRIAAWFTANLPHN